ncbi:MAG TPA: universal stress protein [Ilumatobacter sp.]|jgi:nucleotide-binding universal stress UspA family protein|nr:universal stress protein [Ilumatobacter sp.]
MIQHVVVPVDGSPATIGAAMVGSRIAASGSGTLQLVDVVDHDTRALAHVAHVTPDATVVMSAGARARPPTLLQEFRGPLVLVGPRCDVVGDEALDGTYVVALDGSIGDEGVLPVVAAWTVEFGGTPWLVDVVEPWRRRTPDMVESAYVNHRALRLRRRIGCSVEHETLHGDRPARAILEFAGDAAASLIFVGTDADDRRARRRRRSLAAEIVRSAMCPVVLLRLPEVRHAPRPAPKPAPTPMPPVWSRAWCEQYGPDAVRLRRAGTGTPHMSRR